MYNEEDSPKDKAKAEYELALYRTGKKAAEFVEQHFQNSSNIPTSGETSRIKVALNLLAVIQKAAVPPQ